MMRTSRCCLVMWLAACGGADRTDDAPVPPATTLPPAAVTPSPSPPAASAPSVEATSFAVRVGGEAELDACGGYSRIRRPEGAPPAPVEVRGGPGPQYAVIDRLPDGAEFFSCDSSNGWSGIVYQAPGDDTFCGVSTPVAQRQPYAGPCKAGWIPSGFEELLAG